MPFFVMAIALTLACAAPATAQDTLTNVVVVRGEAIVRRAPDVATITVAVLLRNGKLPQLKSMALTSALQK